jgi:Uma2 family endonuclease
VLDDHSEPQPDVALLAPRSNFYDHAHPRPPDVHLVIEVMETSRSYDRTVKLPLYAHKHVREVWLVDLKADAVDVYRRPAASGYREHQRLVRGTRIAPLAFPRIFFRLADILG